MNKFLALTLIILALALVNAQDNSTTELAQKIFKEEMKKDQVQIQVQQNKPAEYEIIKAKLRVTGFAKTTVASDLINIGLKFNTTSNTAADAIAQNHLEVKEAIKKIKKIDGGDKCEKITTVNFVIFPNYKKDPKTNKPTDDIISFTAITTIQVTVDKKKIAAKVIDTATQCYGEMIWINWQVSDKLIKKAKLELINEAIKDAIYKSKRVAKNLGFKITLVNAASLNDDDLLSDITIGNEDVKLISINKEMNLSIDISFTMEKKKLKEENSN